MKKKVLLSLFFLMGIFVLNAQTTLYYYQLNAIVKEDGSEQWVDASNNKPLKGKYKVVESPTKQGNYILVTMKNGFEEGIEQTFRNGILEVEYTYKGGKKNGPAKKYLKNGQVERDYGFENDKLSGKNIQYFPDGTIKSEANYKNGIMHGREYAYNYNYEYEGGEKVIVKDYNYVEGQLDGRQFERISSDNEYYYIERFFENGKMTFYKETYASGGGVKKEIVDGVHITYYKDGTVETERRYAKPNVLTGEQKSYYPDGQLRRISNYIDNYEEGPVREYYPDGTLKLDEKYEKGHRVGFSTEYYPNGEKQAEWSYRGIRRSGPFKLYYDDGKLKEEGEADYDSYVWRKVYYRNGQLKLYWIVSNGILNEVESYNEDGSQT